MAGSVNRSLRCTCPLDDIDFFEQLWLRSPVIMSRAVPVVRHGDTVDPAQERRGSTIQGGCSPQLYYHDCSGLSPGHTTRAPPVGFELETNVFGVSRLGAPLRP